MKKLVATLIATGMLVGMGTVLGQSTLATTTHDVRITIPQVALLRFTSGASNAAVTTGLEVLFNLTGFDAAAIPGTHSPTSVTAWDDLKVFVNRDITWTVTVGVLQTLGVPFAWNKVTVTASGLASSFNLLDGSIATNTARGWQSLGFGQSDFALNLTGEEIADTYAASVTYTLTMP